MQPNGASTQAVREELERFAGARPGVSFREYELEPGSEDWKRVSEICGYYKLKEQTPLVYGCGRPVVGFEDVARFRQQLQELLTVTVYVRQGCPHCAAAKEWLPQMKQRYPAFEFRLKDVIADSRARQEMQDLVQKHRTAAASLPVFYICGQLQVGFDTAATTGARLEGILRRWTRECPPAEPTQKADSGSTRAKARDAFGKLRVRLVSNADTDEVQSPEDAPLPLPGDAPLPLPNADDAPYEPLPSEAPHADEITLPVFGNLRVEQIGLPLFTIAVGLVDGFNPCAMWVLMFLLSILVNLRDRWKILSVAGTFVLISGLAYFAFMAAWLNVFMLLGLVSWVRLTLACLAIAMGLIHVKDFFAFKRGITLSIPESAKPGIYARVRRIVTAENIAGAVAGAAVLAVLVNMLELLCTAGLPALYTQILMAQQLSSWQNYAYLMLYIAAYMFDDSLMVAVVVITLERHKLQETQGRWLKLISGLAILILGLIMLFRPGWIGMSA